MAYEMLFSPMNIGKMTVKNRIVMTAAEFSLGQTNGAPTERMMDYYEERAKGGVGLIIPGITRVNDWGAPSTFTQLSMSSDRHIAPMREMAARLHRHGAKLCIQLHHPGRQGYASTINSLPLLIPLTERFPKLPNLIFKATPLLLGLEEKKCCMSLQAPSKCELSAHGATRIHAMSRKEIHRLREDFIAAARRCRQADVDAVELHATHGYILQQFLSPHTNQRTDEYGGSFENRMRFITEIIRGIQETCGKDYPLIVRLTVDEMYEKIGRAGVGYTLEEGVRIAQYLEKLGIHALNVSSACYDTYNYWLEPTSFEPGWRAYLAKAVKEAVSIPVIAANFIRSPEQAERQLQAGYQDFIGSARNFICDAYWAKKIENGHPETVRRCIGCLHCMKSFMTNVTVGKPGECALNPAVGREREYAAMPKSGSGKTVVVVGAGPAGLTAAITLARRGFKPILLEKEKQAGGQVNIAAAGPFKDKLHWAIEDMLTEAAACGVDIRTETEATPEMLEALQPYAVLLATGGTPIKPKSIAGIDGAHVLTAPEILLGKKTVKNSRVAVIGSGLTGLETTEKLNEDGNQVTVIEMADTVAGKAWFQFVDDSMSRIQPYGTPFLLSTKLLSINENSVIVEDKNGRQEIPADYVVLAMGVAPHRALANALEEKGVRAVLIGDAAQGGTIGNATQSAFHAAMAL